MTSRYGPVPDWATYLDRTAPDDTPNAHAILAELGDGGCPVAHSDRYAGCRSWHAPLRA